ncbi:MAG: NADH-quinone oxidoreductase subunit F [Kineosporiaceae bacterium]|nr:NADH-quinone oxidoreductase subunit F [Kineosporiaceae bacterium]
MTTTAEPTIAAPRAQGLVPARLLRPGATDLASHRARHGEIAWRGGPNHLTASLEAAGLTGRGGAGFPTWRKVASASGAGRRAVVIANGAEGEPASSKDAVLLTLAPHLVLDGVQLAAEAVGADRVVVYVKAGEAGMAQDTVRRALAERQIARCDRVEPEVVTAPTGFVSGEESAAVAAVEGRAALPTTKRHLVTERGVGGRPTLVQNVETLAHVAVIARYGPQEFRTAGTEAEPGTFLATLGGAVTQPGVVEAGYGIGLVDLLGLAGGADRPLRAVLVGGYHGAWVPAEELASTSMSRAGLAPFGATPGAGIVWALGVQDCPLVVTSAIVGYLAGQSARQCGPCLFGLSALGHDLARLADPAAVQGLDELPGHLAAIAGLVTGRGACRHPDGTVRFVRSSLTTFADEITAHLGGHCTGGAR